MKKKLSYVKGFSLIELMIVVAIIGILAALSVPDYLNFNTRAKQSEVKVNLGGIMTGELSYFTEYGQYTSDFYRTGWSPASPNKYVYDLGDGNICRKEGAEKCYDGIHGIVDSSPDKNADAPGVASKSFTVVAYANLDTDLAIDTWQANDARIIRCALDDSRATTPTP